MTNIYLTAIGVAFGILGAVLGMLALVVAARAARQTPGKRTPDLAAQQDKYPEGHWLGVGMAIGIALGAGLGVPIGIALDNLALGLALGPGMGVAIGVAIGSALEQRHKDEIRPLTEHERRTRTGATTAGVLILAIGMMALAAILLARATI